MEDSFFFFHDLYIITLSPWARFPGTIVMSLNRKKKTQKPVAGCTCGFGKVFSGIFVRQPLDGRMLSLLIWVPVLSFTAQGYFSEVEAPGLGCAFSFFFSGVLGRHWCSVGDLDNFKE